MTARASALAAAAGVLAAAGLALAFSHRRKTLRISDGKTGTGVCIRTTEMHTGGEPVRIVESGYPELIP